MGPGIVICGLPERSSSSARVETRHPRDSGMIKNMWIAQALSRLLRRRRKLTLPTFDMGQPRVEIADRDQLFDLMDGMIH